MKKFLLLFLLIIATGMAAIPDKPVRFVNSFFYGEFDTYTRRHNEKDIIIKPGLIMYKSYPSHKGYHAYRTCKDPIVNTMERVIMECDYHSKEPGQGMVYRSTHGIILDRKGLYESIIIGGKDYSGGPTHLSIYTCWYDPYYKKTGLQIALEMPEKCSYSGYGKLRYIRKMKQLKEFSKVTTTP